MKGRAAKIKLKIIVQDLSGFESRKTAKSRKEERDRGITK
jgi:hypothetical protein